jgi:hypothetical protein
MKRWLLRRRMLTLFGALGAFGMAVPTGAAPLTERSALEARVAEMRRHLQEPAAREASTTTQAGTLLAQAGRWNNWPNWSNWANWRNG